MLTISPVYLAQAPSNIFHGSPSLTDGVHAAWLGTQTRRVPVPATGVLVPPTVTSWSLCTNNGLHAPRFCTLSLCLLFCCWLALADPWKFNSDITAVTSFLLSALPIGLVAPLSSHRLLHYPQLQFFPLYIEWGQNLKQNCIYTLVIYTYGKRTY